MAYCYKWISMICQFVTIISPAKMAEPSEMSFGLWSRVSPGNHAGVQMPPCKGVILRGKGRPIVKKYRDSLPWAVWKLTELMEMPFGMWTLVGPMKHFCGSVRLIPLQTALTSAVVISPYKLHISQPGEYDWGSDAALWQITLTTIRKQYVHTFLYNRCVWQLVQNHTDTCTF